MVKIKKITGSEVYYGGLDDRIVDLDRHNMSEILSDAEVTFPEEMRRKGFEGNPTIFIALVDSKLVGYLQYSRSWDDERDIYVSSIQILSEYRHGPVLTALLNVAREALLREKFDSGVSEVLKTNISAIRLYQKLGFTISTHPQKRKYYSVSGTRSILENSPVLKTIKRYNKPIRLDTEPAKR